ncbi:hypothetical protein P691DRAFT_356456 [Macrolepiota fuliginosa MF-IS2]|uniref:Uncharacterized protein n=1 Tax=Macrolepiota fuliginosa MF-IS2 TaxID=1400762 RepID=A0A9P5X443_9AGAR|nr:hypothetical protein P691DRAFT_356456 [Macrolepiota fuliginosa MF-IS2]
MLQEYGTFVDWVRITWLADTSLARCIIIITTRGVTVTRKRGRQLTTYRSCPSNKPPYCHDFGKGTASATALPQKMHTPMYFALRDHDVIFPMGGIVCGTAGLIAHCLKLVLFRIYVQLQSSITLARVSLRTRDRRVFLRSVSAKSLLLKLISTTNQHTAHRRVVASALDA